jgi:hypothetical protein
MVRSVKQDTHAYYRRESLIFRGFVLSSYELVCCLWVTLGELDDIWNAWGVSSAIKKFIVTLTGTGDGVRGEWKRY